MSLVRYLAAGAFLINLALAILIATRRGDRPVNRAFLFLNFTCGLWVACMWIGVHQQNATALETWVRLTTMGAALIPLALFLLTRVVITGDSFSTSFRRHKGWLIVTAVMVVFCGTRYFLKSVEVPSDPSKMATPDYGPAFPIYAIWYVGAFVLTEVQAWRSRKRLSSIARLELDYIIIGIFLFNFLAVAVAGVAPILWKDAQVHQLAPVWIVILDLIVAYGISTQKLLGVSSLARRAASYALLIAYLGILYALAWGLSKATLLTLGTADNWPAYLVGAIAVALSMGPAQLLSRKVVQKLFVNSGAIDPQEGVRRLDVVRSETISLEQIAARSLRVFAELAGTDSGSIHLLSPAFSSLLDGRPSQQPLGTEVSQAAHSAPVIASLLPRRRETSVLVQEMKTMEAAVAIEIPGGKRGQGVVLLGERLTGRLYESDDVAALQIMAAHLGAALSNALLYLEKARTSIYQSTVLDQLVVGVIAVDAERNISTLNREATRILAEADALMPPKILAHLPEPLQKVIEEAATAPVLQKEVILGGGTANPISLRVACQCFLDADGSPLGASLTCQDVSSIKLLEQQLIESDRMAGLGHFSAVIAHEIKNPLVGIRTFAQLIPERKGDDKFLDQWAQILNNEVERIDAIVRQLLAWGKPSERKMVPMFAEDALDSVLALYRPELKKKRITLATDWPKTKEQVIGDFQKLQQVFSNLVLNAIQAMPDGGSLRVKVDGAALVAAAHLFDAREGQRFVRIEILDSGVGMEGSELDRIFQSSGALISSKEGGSGFGLSVVKQIISEHKGALAADSSPRKGSCFYALLPSSLG